MKTSHIEEAAHAHSFARFADTEAGERRRLRDDHIRCAYEEGSTIPEIASALGLSNESVSKILGRRGHRSAAAS